MAFNPVRACRENSGLGCHRVKHDLRISHEIILHDISCRLRVVDWCRFVERSYLIDTPALESLCEIPGIPPTAVGGWFQTPPNKRRSNFGKIPPTAVGGFFIPNLILPSKFSRLHCCKEPEYSPNIFICRCESCRR